MTTVTWYGLIRGRLARLRQEEMDLMLEMRKLQKQLTKVREEIKHNEGYRLS